MTNIDATEIAYKNGFEAGLNKAFSPFDRRYVCWGCDKEIPLEYAVRVSECPYCGRIIRMTIKDYENLK